MSVALYAWRAGWRQSWQLALAVALIGGLLGGRSDGRAGGSILATWPAAIAARTSVARTLRSE